MSKFRVVGAVIAFAAPALLAEVVPAVEIGPGPLNHVSLDRAGAPHVEPHLATHPENPDFLVGAAIEFLGSESVVHAFVSDDRGRSWRRYPLSAWHQAVEVLSGEGDPGRLDSEGVLALLDYMDAVAALHPGFERRGERLDALPSGEREAAFDEARRRNEADVELRAALDALLATRTYQIYFRRFRNVTPELVRDLLLDLPYRKRQSPGDVAATYWELVRRRRSVRSDFARLIEALDMERVYENARRWSPHGADEVPTVHFVYDSNAGSFAAEGRPFLNLYSEGYFAASAPVTARIAEIEGTMAHEIQHALADPYLYPKAEAELPWRQRRLQALMRSMVGEGVASHCNPPAGAKRELYEDELVVAALLRRLEAFLSDLRHHRLTEEEARAWARDNYFDEAMALLRRHLRQRFSGEELEGKIVELTPTRPDLEHVLGWWMVSRISRGGERRDLAVGLLTDPWALLPLYAEATTAARPELRLSPQALDDLRALRADRSSSEE